jgi:O-antigen/teichoic acid export membrane protein
MIADISCKPLNAGFNNVFYSELSKDVGKKDGRIFLFSIKILLIILITLYLILLIFLDDIVNFLYGEEFKVVSKYFSLIMPASILISLSTIFYSYFSSKGLQKIFLNGIFFSLLLHFFIFFIFKNVLAEKSLFLSITLSSIFLIIYLIKNFLKLNNLLISSLLISKHELKLFKLISYRYVFKK